MIFDLQNQLDSNEKIILFFRPSRMAYLLNYVLGIIIFLFWASVTIFSSRMMPILAVSSILVAWTMLIIVIILLMRIEYRIFSRRYALTTERVLYSNGIFREIFKSTTYDDVTDIALYQNLWDKIVNTGTITLNTAGTPGYEIRYRKVRDPIKIKKMINDGMDQLRRTKYVPPDAFQSPTQSRPDSLQGFNERMRKRPEPLRAGSAMHRRR
jgi:hypothetical protein